jgi:hypothetical protein
MVANHNRKRFRDDNDDEDGYRVQHPRRPPPGLPARPSLNDRRRSDDDGARGDVSINQYVQSFLRSIF